MLLCKRVYIILWAKFLFFVGSSYFLADRLVFVDLHFIFKK